MRRAHRFPQRPVRWTSLFLCFTVVLSVLTTIPLQSVNGRGFGYERRKKSATSLSPQVPQGRREPPKGNGKKVDPAPPQPGPPAIALPNLNEARRRRADAPHAPEPIASTMRSKRKALKGAKDRKASNDGLREPAGTRTGIASYQTEIRSGRAIRPLARSHHAARSVTPGSGSITVVPPQGGSGTAYSGTPISIPGMLEIECYNNGGAEIAYHDTSPGSHGQDYDNPPNYPPPSYRQPTDVDIYKSAGGYSNGYLIVMQGGDWMNYSVNVTQTGTYTMQARVAWGGAGGVLGTFHVEVDGIDKTGPIQMPDTNWSLSMISKTGLQLTAGQHVVRVVADTNAANGYMGDIDYLNFVFNGSGATDAERAAARLDPFNQPGNQLLARDCEWSLPLVSLPGRAGLDLGLSLSYSSQVWTRAGSYLYFDEDDGSPSPGFRLGFPTIQNPFFDNQAGVNARLLVTSSGRKVELRQVGSSNLYEAGDSSYLQLFDYGSSLWMRTTDGTQMAFAAAGDQWVCWLIKDRNGNQITANYNAQGDLSSVIDTLGRVINFNYDGNANLSSITQNGRSEPWATFGWSTLTLQPGFGLPTVAPSEGIPVLTQVGLDDESRYNFEYTAQGQVKMIRRYTFDNSQYVERSYTAYDYETPTGDCPRISAARVWAENWSDLYGVPHEVPTYFHDNGDGSHQMTSPDGTIYKESYGASGWQRGLSLMSEVWTGGVRQKWSTLGWIQDNPAANYQTNPRVIQTTVDDAVGNHRRTTINYDHLNYAQYGLPFLVTEYGGVNGETELRRTYTDYNLSQPYQGWHIIGLVSSVYLYDPATAQWSAKTTYGYDAPALIDPQATTAIQHDQSYSASFTIRGNLTSVSRWDANDIENGSKALTTQMAYDAAGSVISTRDPLNHVASFHFGDSFTDGVNHNTFAYVTTVTDPDGNNSSTQFNYLFGGQTRVQGPPASNQPNGTGAVQTFAYDAARRLEQVTTLNNGAYVRYIYQGNAVHQYSTVNSIADEAYSTQFFDGAGHAIYAASNHPASTGLYRAVYTIYDAMGRAVKQSNPTEVTAGAAPTGDDAAGWIFTQQTYDWKGRPLVTTNTDGRQKSASYTACGCAGSEATTVMDEAGRQTRTTNDALGRLAKVEELNWDASVYSTANYSYDALDHLTNVNHEGQVRSFAYDGYGRMQTRTTPEQGTTTYAYNPDDTTQSVTDARGVTATYGYNNRHLVTSIIYNVSGDPTGQTSATPNVYFSYDAAGNRMAIYDGLGSTHYGYDQLSRMTAETRHFNDLPNNYDLTYGYNLAGELTGITNSWSVQVGYAYDQAGRLTNVSGANYAGVSNYASGINYRAFGAIKGMSYGDGHSLSTGYDNRLRPTTWNVSGVLGYNYAYDYYSEHTGRVTYAQNIASGSPPTNGAPDPTLDRSYQYDQVGALVVAHSGAEARASAYSGQWGTMDGPYSHGYDYDKFGNLTHRYGWGGEVQGGTAGQTSDKYYNYSNNKNQRDGFTYDLAGNLTNDGAQSYSYDATGQQATATASNYFLQQGYDGDGLRAQKTENGAATYYLRSSVLGGKVVAEIDGSGNFSRGYVYAGSELLAVQQQSAVNWVHEDSVTKSQRVTDANGNLVDSGTVELDPWGANTNRSSNSAFQPQQFTTYIRDANGGQDAMARRYATSSARFSQPDPYGGSYDYSSPQSFNRYAYAGNDPVNFADPTGLNSGPPDCGPGTVAKKDKKGDWQCVGTGVSVVTVTGSWDDMSGYLPSWTSNDVFIRILLLGGDPQNTGPTIAFGPKYQNLIQPFKDAFDDAVDRLNKKKDCAKLFGGLQKALNTLNSATYRLVDNPPELKYQNGKWAPSVTGAATYPGNMVTINLSGPFFNGPDLKMSGNRSFKADFGTDLKGSDLAALLLLHELGHQVGKWGSDAGVGDKDKNLEHTMAVFKACF